MDSVPECCSTCPRNQLLIHKNISFNYQPSDQHPTTQPSCSTNSPLPQQIPNNNILHQPEQIQSTTLLNTNNLQLIISSTITIIQLHIQSAKTLKGLMYNQLQQNSPEIQTTVYEKENSSIYINKHALYLAHHLLIQLTNDPSLSTNPFTISVLYYFQKLENIA